MRLAAACLLWVSVLAAGSGSAAPPQVRFVRAPDAAFPGDPAPWARRPFDIVATDMDLDGDVDLLVNWHHHGRLELFEGRDGRFVLANPPDDDASGLYENRGVPGMFAESEAVEARLASGRPPGLGIWHEANRGGQWQLSWSDADGRYAGAHLELVTSLQFLSFEGVAEEALERPDDRTARIALPGEPTRFRFGTYPVGVQLRLRLQPGGSGAAPPIRAGDRLTPVPGAELSLWKPDPHGMAWVHVEGSGHPELFVTRGGLGGLLAPPAEPKTDRYYVRVEGTPPYRMAEAGVVPSGYGRGRRVEWVDIDNDGSLELSVANESTPNAVLVRDPETGRFRDAAQALGLDLREGAVQAWLDLDADARQDLLYLEGDEVRVAWNRETGFEHASARPLGLALPSLDKEAGLFDSTALRLADFDADGDLDVYVLSRGANHVHHLFLREGARFRDATQAVGLGRARGQRAVVLLDVDNDGFEDAVGFDPKPWVWRNVGGKRFRVTRLRAPVSLGRRGAATALDADGDGRTDLAAVSQRRHLLMNRGGAGNGYLDVVPRDGDRTPIGALVRAVYADGRRPVRRLGSASSSAFSQAIQPLHFGVPRGARIERIEVVWPGEREAESYPVDRTGTTRIVSRRGER